MPAKCPYCGRELTKHERICYHCEQDVSKAVDEYEKVRLPKPRKYDLKKDIDNYKSLFRRILNRSKEKKVAVFDAYCVKCKKKVNAKNPTEYTMKNGMLALKGVCPTCSTKVFRIIGKKK